MLNPDLTAPPPPASQPIRHPPDGRRRLRVLHVVRQFHPSVGGLETYVTELASRQADEFDVTILTLNRVFGNPQRLPARENRHGLNIVRIPFVGRRKLFLPFLSFRFLRQFDIVHVHAADQLLDVIAMLSRFSRFRLFMTTHGLFFHTQSLAAIKALYLRTITRWSLRRCERVIAVSGNDAATLQPVCGRTTLLRNPIVPLGDFIGSGRDLLYLGRLSENKRVAALIDFMGRLAEQDGETRLHIVGSDGDHLWPQLRTAIEQRGLEDRIIFHDYLDREALQACARLCGFIVSASRFEGFGLAMVEGMSVGLLPVMHANAAFTEIHDLSGCGLLTDFDTPRDAADAFLSWRTGVSDSDRHQAARYAHAQSWDAISTAHADFYHRRTSLDEVRDDRPAA